MRPLHVCLWNVLSALLLLQINGYYLAETYQNFIRTAPISYRSFSEQTYPKFYASSPRGILFYSIATRHQSTATPVDEWEASIEYKLRGHLMRNELQLAAAVLRNLKSSTLDSGRNIVYAITETCRRQQRAKNIMPLLLQIPTHVFDCKDDDIMPLLVQHANNGNMHLVQPVVSLLRKRGIRLSPKTLSVLLSGYGRQMDETMVDKVMMWCDTDLDSTQTSKGRADVVLLNSAMDAYIRCGKVAKAHALFLAATESDEALNVPAVRSLLRDSATSGQPASASSVTSPSRLPAGFASIRRSGIQVNVRTCNTLMKGYRSSSAQSHQRCEQVLDTMKSLSILPDSVTMNTLVDAYALAGEMAQAESLLRNPIAAPGVEAFTSLIAGYAARGQVNAAFRVLDLMEERCIKPNCYTLTALMNACLKAGWFDTAKDLLRRGVSLSHKDLTQTEKRALYSAYITGLCKLHQIMCRSCEVQQRGLGYDSSQLDMQSAAVSDREKRDQYLVEVQLSLMRMEAEGMLPGTTAMNAFIQSICATDSYHAAGHHRLTQALRLFQTTLQIGLQPDSYTYSVLFTALGDRGMVNEILSLYEASTNLDGLVLDTTAVNSLIRAFVSSSEPLQAFALFYALAGKDNGARNDVSPTTGRANGVSSSTDDQNQVRGVTAEPNSIMLQQMFVPDVVSFTMLVVALVRHIAGASEAAGRIGAVDKDGAEGKPRALQDGVDYPESALIVVERPSKPSPLWEVYETLNIVRVKQRPSDTVNNPSSVAAKDEASGAGSSSKDAILAENETDLTDISYFSTAQAKDQSSSKNDISYSTLSSSSNISDTSSSIDMDFRYDQQNGRLYEGGSKAPTRSSRSNVVVKKEDDITVGSSITPLANSTATASAVSDLNSSFIVPDDSETLRMSLQRTLNEEDFKSKSPEQLLDNLFKAMRNEYRITPDARFCRAINSLFSTFSSSSTSSSSSPPSIAAASFLKPRESKRSSQFEGFSKDISRMIFEDLVICGGDPRQMTHLLSSCGYAQRVEREFLEAGAALKVLRSSSASYRIFKKHGWNKVDSGWAPLF